MPSTFPSVLTSYTSPNSTDKLSSPSHSGIETNQNSGIAQLEKVIGVEGSASVIGTLEYFIKSPASDGGGHIQAANKGGTGQTGYAKGDLIVASSTSVLSKLSVGTDGFAPIADSTASAGISWQGVAGAKQIQNQQYTYARASVYSASVYGINLTTAVSVLSDGLGVQVKFPTTNTTSVLALQVNATGPSSVAARIKNVDGTNPIVGAIQASMIGELVFDSVSSVFQLQNTYIPTYGTSTTTFLRNDGTFSPASVPLGVWDTSSYSTGTAYQAATDGFLLAVMTDAGNAGTCQMLSDASNPPTTVRADTGFGSAGIKHSMTIPVKKTDYFKVTVSGASNSAALQWLPLGS